MRRYLTMALLLTLGACGASDVPTAPVAPVTPTPATPAPVAPPAVNAFAAACGTPLPPFASSYGFGIKVQLEPSKNKKIINASPILQSREYCEAAGLPGSICNTRFEFLAERVPCDNYLAGISDTGRPGPNWFQKINGQLLKCGGMGVQGDAPDCRLKDNNQYLLDVLAAGTYVACGGKGSPGTCGVCVLRTFGTINESPAGLCGNDG